MFEQVLDSVRKMSESTIQMQQEFYKQWMSHLPTTAMMSPASTGGGVAEQAQSLQKRWMDSVTELMNKQREASMRNTGRGFRPSRTRSASPRRRAWRNIAS